MPSELSELLERATGTSNAPEPDFADLARRGRHRRRRMHVGSAVALALVVVLAVVNIGRLDRPTVVFDSRPRPGVGAWEPVPPSPLGPRESAVAVSADNHVFVIGGHADVTQGPKQGDIWQDDGAVYDLDARTWTPIPAPPIPTMDRDRLPTPQVLEDGRLLIVNTMSEVAGALYSPATGAWTATGSAPLSGRGGAVVEWTDGKLVVWGGIAGKAGAGLADGAVWDEVTGEWTAVSPAPLAGRGEAAAAWTGDRLLLWGGSRGSAMSDSHQVFADGAAYDPLNDRWEVLPDAPLEGRAGAEALWTGRELVVIGGVGREVLTNRAALEAPQPEPTYSESCNGTQCTGGASVSARTDPNFEQTFYTDGARYDPRNQTWKRAAAPPPGLTQGDVAAAGDMVVGVTRGNLRAAYDVSRDAWLRLGDLPLPEGVQLLAVGDRVVGLNSGEIGLTTINYPRRLGGWVTGATRMGWEVLAEAATPQRSNPAVAATGDRVFVWGGTSVTRDITQGYQGEPGTFVSHDDGAVLTLP